VRGGGGGGGDDDDDDEGNLAVRMSHLSMNVFRRTNNPLRQCVVSCAGSYVTEVTKEPGLRRALSCVTRTCPGLGDMTKSQCWTS
jgi:hypothetical protein